MAVVYYDKKNYNKAFPLFEELLSLYKGTEKAEKIYYYYAYCNFYLEDYILASHHFKNYTKTFPTSSRTEECEYMGAYCFFMDSPAPSLDQTNTVKAISEMQYFINQYPQSPKVAEANTIIDKLRYKLETKNYEIAKLYYNIGDYKAAISALSNVLKEYPDSKYRDEVAFLVVKSHYLLATNSIENKKEERLKSTAKAYLNFIDNNPKNPNLKEAEGIYTNTLKELKKYKI